MADDGGAERRRGAWHDDRRALAKGLLESPCELLECLTREPFTLRDRVGLTVRWGVAMNLVRFDGESGLAYAQQDLDQVDPTLWSDFRSDIGVDDPDELEFHFQMNAPFFVSDAEMRAYNDLCYALETGYGQSVALAASQRAAPALQGVLSYPEEDSYPGMKQMRSSDVAVNVARYLLPRVAIIAEEDTSSEIGPVLKTRMIPERVYDEFLPIVEFFRHSESGTKQELWFYELLFHFERPLRGREPREIVGLILWMLVGFNHFHIPDAFTDPRPEHVARAVEFIRTHRIDTSEYDSDDEMGAPRYEPDAPRRGPALSPWTAAARFARCFGITTVPEREKDARRHKLRSVK